MKNSKYLFLFLALAIVAFVQTDAKAQAPTQAQTDAARNKPCGDPWINIAFQQLGYGALGGFANAGDCNTALYNGGSWNNYDELKSYVRQSQEAMTKAGYEYALAKLSDGSGKLAIVVTQGGSVVASGGGNVIAPGGANVVAAGGLNLQTTLASLNNLPIANLIQTNQYTVFSADKKVIKLGKNAIVFARK